MKIDITDEPNRVEAERQISLQHPEKHFVPVWEPSLENAKKIFMVDEEEIAKDIEHYQKMVGSIWFVINNGFIEMKMGILTL